jgi:hypothetical protein
MHVGSLDTLTTYRRYSDHFSPSITCSVMVHCSVPLIHLLEDLATILVNTPDFNIQGLSSAAIERSY